VSPVQSRKVTIVYRMLPQYRVEFYEGLRALLEEKNIHLDLFYGKDKKNLKRDEVDLSWGTVVSQREFKILGKQLMIQTLPDSIYKSSLIVLVQENKILSNFAVAAQARRRGVRLAFWGHGTNFQDRPNSLSNRLKRGYSANVDWWFAYTPKVAQIIEALPYPRERITIVNNAIDTRGLADGLATINEKQKSDLRNELNIGNGPVGIYCGAMYSEKRLPFLFEACERVRSIIPEFELVLIGAGPHAGLVKEFAASREWVHYVGPKFGLEKVPLFSVSDVFLMPGLVGLAVLDSFALGTPLITTNFPFHSPEIEYLESGRNGLISDDNIAAYAETIVDALKNPRMLRCLRENGRKDIANYTVEAMVSNFAGGILKALDVDRIR